MNKTKKKKYNSEDKKQYRPMNCQIIYHPKHCVNKKMKALF